MVDPISAIGLVASIMQVTGTGLKLSKDIYVYAQSVKDTNKRLQDIARHIEFTASIIRELGSLFEDQAAARLISESAVKTADGTIRECETVFNEMAALVEKSQGRGKKYLFPFREAKIELLRANLERLKSSLQLLLQILTHAQVVASQNQYSSQILLQREHIKKLIKSEEVATQKYKKERLEYQNLLEKLNESTATEPMDRLERSSPSKASFGTRVVPYEQEYRTIVHDRNLPIIRDTLSPARPKLEDTELPIEDGISRSELDYCVRRLQALIGQIEYAQIKLRGPTSIYTHHTVFEAYANIRADLDPYLLKENVQIPDTGSISSDPGQTLVTRPQCVNKNRYKLEIAGGPSSSDYLAPSSYPAPSGYPASSDIPVRAPAVPRRNRIKRDRMALARRQEEENKRLEKSHLDWKSLTASSEDETNEVAPGDGRVDSLLLEWTTISLERIDASRGKESFRC